MVCERIFIKTHNVENRWVKGPENLLFKGSFSQENLQAGAMKGLNTTRYKDRILKVTHSKARLMSNLRFNYNIYFDHDILLIEDDMF